MWLSKNASCKTVHIRATRACQWLFLPPLPQQWLLLWVPRHTWSCFLPYALRLFHSAFIPAHPLKLPLGLFHVQWSWKCAENGLSFNLIKYRIKFLILIFAGIIILEGEEPSHVSWLEWKVATLSVSQPTRPENSRYFSFPWVGHFSPDLYVGATAMHRSSPLLKFG